MTQRSLRNLLPDTTPSDTLLLLPLLQSGAQSSLPGPCLHTVPLDGTLTFCNTNADESCPVCLRPICEEHQSPRWTALLDEYALPADPSLHFLCETCAVLPSRVLSCLQVLRLSFNEQLAEEQIGNGRLRTLHELPDALSPVCSYIKTYASHLEILGVAKSVSGAPLLSVKDTSNLDIVVAFGTLSDLVHYLRYFSEARQEALHEL